MAGLCPEWCPLKGDSPISGLLPGTSVIFLAGVAMAGLPLSVPSRPDIAHQENGPLLGFSCRCTDSTESLPCLTVPLCRVTTTLFTGLPPPCPSPYSAHHSPLLTSVHATEQPKAIQACQLQPVQCSDHLPTLAQFPSPSSIPHLPGLKTVVSSPYLFLVCNDIPYIKFYDQGHQTYILLCYIEAKIT